MTWRVTTLEGVAVSIRNGLFAKRPSDLPPGTPILRINAVRGGAVAVDDLRYVAGLEQAQADKFAVDPGDLLVTRYNGSRNLVGIAGLVGHDAAGVIHPDKLIRVVVDRDVADPRFVNLQLQSQVVRSFLETRIRTTAGQSGISGIDVKQIPLTLPDIREQRRVIDLLEDLLSRLDAGAADLEMAAGRLANLRMARLTQLRRSWSDVEVEPLGAIADTALGKMLDAKRQTGELTRYLRNINVRWGSFDLDDVQSTLMTEADTTRFDVRPGDLMVCEGGEPGRCAVWREDMPGMSFQKALHRVRVRDAERVLPEFVAMMLTEAIRSGRCDRLLTGTTIKHLPQERLRVIEIAVPDIGQQRQVVDVDRAAIDDERRLGVALSQARARHTALRRAVLTAAFSGQLTGRASDLERVEELVDA